MYKLTDEFSDIDSFENGYIPDEVFGVLENLKEAKKEARKEVRLESRKRFDNYKFKLNKI